MRVRILGCHGGETPRHRTTCFLLDSRMTIDAGAVCRSLELDEQIALDHMLISHSHMDHVKDLALLADQVIGRRQKPIYLHCLGGSRVLAVSKMLKGKGYDIRPLKAGYPVLLKSGFEKAKPKPPSLTTPGR